MRTSTIRYRVREFVEHHGPVNNLQVREGLKRKSSSVNRALADLAKKGMIKRVRRGNYDVEGQRQKPMFPMNARRNH